MAVPLSILDLAPIRPGETATESFAASVALARLAERHGYTRVWYAEHHNMPSIASSATSVLIAHVGAHTETIRLGAGGVMLPNHAPLTIAEQFGTLAALHPGRIDLGLGRAPGSDQNTMFALRRDPSTSDRFPQDVLELQGYLTDNDASARRQRHAGPGQQRAPLHPGIVAVRRPARSRARPAVRVRVPLLAAGADRRGRAVPPRVPPVRPARPALRHRRRERDRRRLRRCRPGPVPDREAHPGQRATGARTQAHRRGSRPGAGLPRGPAHRVDGQVLRGRTAAATSRITSTTSPSTPMPTSSSSRCSHRASRNACARRNLLAEAVIVSQGAAV